MCLYLVVVCFWKASAGNYCFGIHFLKDYDKLLSLNLRLISGFQILSVLDVHMCIMSGLGVF